MSDCLISHTSYDAVPYPSGPISMSHPSRVATVAKLFGLTPPPVDDCRVLELGCASGGNLIPMAMDLPASEFVGIDLSARQIADGKRFLVGLPAENIQLHHTGILDVDDQFGHFDYIICHGVYSWVPRGVQDKILQIGRQLLTPNGILYVSYNTYPGWYLRGVVRDMMRYHTAPFADPDEKIAQARALLGFLVDSATVHSEAYRQLLKEEALTLEKAQDAYLYHEHLEEVNDPVYFHQFAERAEQAGLRYLGDADFNSMLTNRFQAETAAILRDVPLLRQEQYMDFLTARTFRMSLLCHEQTLPDRRVPPARLVGTHVRLTARLPEKVEDSGSRENNEKMLFANEKHSLTTSNAFVQSAIKSLNESWPRFVPVDVLLSRASVTEIDEPSADQAALLDDLMILLSRDIIQLRVTPPPVTANPGPRPSASLLARKMAELGSVVTNLMHESVKLDDLSRFVLLHLDGKRDRPELSEQLRKAVDRGEFRVSHEGKDLGNVHPPLCAEILDHVLQTLAAHSLLIQRKSLEKSNELLPDSKDDLASGVCRD